MGDETHTSLVENEQFQPYRSTSAMVALTYLEVIIL